MVHLKALGIKAIAIGITVYSLFGIFYNANLMNLFWISVLTTGIAYLIGDLFILRKFGNLTASIADFPLAFMSLWALGILMLEASIPIAAISLMAAFFITCCEPFIHAYLIEQGAFEDAKEEHEDAQNVQDKEQLQTEYAEEFPSEDLKDEEEYRDK